MKLKLLSCTFIVVLVFISSCSNQNSASKTDSSSVIESKTNDYSVNVTEVLSDVNKKIENHSPDKAVKSRWLIVENLELLSKKECENSKNKKSEFHKTVFELLGRVTDGALLKKHSKIDSCSNYVYSREITEVKTESETRAIVFAKIKNITPIPEGAIAGEHEKNRRAEGTEFKYVTEKSVEGWKVVKVYEKSEFNNSWFERYKLDSEPDYPFYVFTD